MKIKNILATASAAVLVLGVSVNVFAGENCKKEVSERTPAANTVVTADIESPQKNYISSRLER